MRVRFFKIGLLWFIFFAAFAAQADDLCNPVVEPVKTETTLALMLTNLAEKYNFSLSFPKSLDQSVHVDESMELDHLVKMLTSGMNTVLRYEKVEDCTGLRLSELIVIPVGDETEFINVEQKPTAKPVEYIYIDNMEQYVRQVLLREHKANVKNMTPEQAIEFKNTKRRLRKELKAEIKKTKNKDKSKNKKTMQEGTIKNISKDGVDG